MDINKKTILNTALKRYLEWEKERLIFKKE